MSAEDELLQTMATLARTIQSLLQTNKDLRLACQALLDAAATGGPEEIRRAAWSVEALLGRMGKTG